MGETEEKPHFYFANFMDQLMIDARRRQSSAKVKVFNAVTVDRLLAEGHSMIFRHCAHRPSPDLPDLRMRPCAARFHASKHGTWLAQATTKALDRMGGKARIDVGRDKPYIEWLPLVRC